MANQSILKFPFSPYHYGFVSLKLDLYLCFSVESHLRRGAMQSLALDSIFLQLVYSTCLLWTDLSESILAERLSVFFAIACIFSILSRSSWSICLPPSRSIQVKNKPLLALIILSHPSSSADQALFSMNCNTFSPLSCLRFSSLR